MCRQTNSRSSEITALIYADRTLRAYDRDGTSHAAPGITVHVVPVLREIPMPAAAVDAFPLAINEHGDVVGHWREAAVPT